MCSDSWCCDESLLELELREEMEEEGVSPLVEGGLVKLEEK